MSSEKNFVNNINPFLSQSSALRDVCILLQNNKTLMPEYGLSLNFSDTNAAISFCCLRKSVAPSAR